VILLHLVHLVLGIAQDALNLQLGVVRDITSTSSWAMSRSLSFS
jgi:hypothetical protein